MNAMMASTRCQHCLNLLTQLLSSNEQNVDKYTHWRTFGELEDSSMAGCDLCALLRQKLVFSFLQSRAWPDSEAELSLGRGSGRSNLFPGYAPYFESEEKTGGLSVHCGAPWGTSWETIGIFSSSGNLTLEGTAYISSDFQGVFPSKLDGMFLF